MQDLYSRLTKDSKWFSEKHPAVTAVAQDWRNWLHSRASLTERLIAFSGDRFEVRVLSQCWGKPLLHEANSLNIPMHLAVRVREVELYCSGIPIVFARTIMPLQVFLDQRHVLANIGTRPLGQLLFKDGQMRASKRSVSVYQSGSDSVVYGRSTPYHYADKEILVSEFFINPILIS